MGKIQVDGGNYDEGRRYLRRCLEANPKHLEARFLVGLAEHHAGNPGVAAGAFELVLEEVPGHVGALYNLGRVLLETDREEEGRKRLDEFRAMSALEDEIEFHQRAVKKNPRALEGRVFLADLLLKSGRTEEAFQELLVARQIDRERPSIYLMMGQALRRMGRVEDAVQAESIARALGGRKR